MRGDACGCVVGNDRVLPGLWIARNQTKDRDLAISVRNFFFDKLRVGWEECERDHRLVSIASGVVRSCRGFRKPSRSFLNSPVVPTESSSRIGESDSIVPEVLGYAGGRRFGNEGSE